MRHTRKNLLTLILLAICTLAMAQKRSRLDVQRADKLFDEFQFSEAALLYEKLVNRDSTFNYAKLKLAESYRKMNQPEEASTWYAQIVNDSISQPIHKLYYAKALMSTGRADEARNWLETYKNQTDDDRRADNLIAGIDNYEAFFKDSERYKLDSVDFNSEGADFSPAYFRKGLVFSSNRSKFSLLKRKHGWDNTNFLQLYYTDHESDSIDKTVPFSSRLNTRFHEGPLTFYDNYEKVIFTRNNYNRSKLRKAEDETIHLQMYLADRRNIGEEWKRPAPFPYNNKEYSVGHPSISTDEATLYFASNMPGGQGGVDLYVSRFVNDQWTTPVNLGPKINTSGDEMFPHISDSLLYFSSDGHYGMGGLDLYHVDLFDSSSRVTNLGAPMNSNRDDFGIILDESGKAGYYTSNREGGKGSDDIYKFEITRPPSVAVRGMVVDQRNGQPVDNAEVVLNPGMDNSMSITTNADGTFEFELDWDQSYDLMASKTDWTTGLDSVATFNSKISEEFVTIPIRQLLVISGQLTNPEDGSPVDNALLTFTNSETGEVDSVSTSNTGVLYFIAQPDQEYDVFLQKRGFFNFRSKVSTGPEPAGKIAFDLEMEQIIIGRAIRIENIYFDLNKSDIRPDAAIELDKIVQMMTDNPTIQIELGAHTDSRGGDAYNLALSDRRARSSAAYIVSRGISQANIVGKGFGETQLVNGCANGVTCDTDEHQANRRTEFKVVSF